MRILPPSLSLSACLLLFLFSTSNPLKAQKSAAELIATVPPPAGDIKFTDGSRQIDILGNYLFITNFWAGLQVVDISDIRHPQEIAFFKTEGQSYYNHIEGDYAYLANHSSGIQVFDISDIEHISSVGEIATPGNAFWSVSEYPYLFAALGDQGFIILDISDIHNPVTISLEVVGEWVQQIYKKDDLLFLAVKKDGFIIYDISNLEEPKRLSQFRTGYNAMKIQVVDDLAYIADGPGGLLIVDVSDPAFPVEVQRIFDVGFVGDIHKVGNYAYLANQDIGLQIINISDPARPFMESFYSTENKSYGVYKKDVYVFLAANSSTLIMRHNNAPILEDITDMTLQENVPFSLQLEASEPDGDPIRYEIVNLPENAVFDSLSGHFAWTPNYEQSGVYQNVIFRVIELTASRLTASDTVSLIVEHINRLPDLPAPEDASVDENQTLTFTISKGTDPDKEDQNRLTYRAEQLPEGASFDPATRTFSWTPTFEQSGIYTVDFLMDDGGGGIDREPVTLTVFHVGRKPLIDVLEAQTTNEAATLTLTLTGTELDIEDQDKISFEMENLPPGATFDPATRIFSWTPNYDQSGTYADITAIMTAGESSDTTAFSITVNHLNRPPVLDDITDQKVDENQLLTFVISGNDPDVEDKGKLSYSTGNFPEGATFDPNSRTFQWTPTFEQAGQYPEVLFSITDPSGLSDTKSITVTVNHVNRSPSITDIDNQSIQENESLSFQLSASDPDREDAEKLTFSAVGLPVGANLDSRTGTFQWTPTFDQSGNYSLVFVISDGQYSDSTHMSMTVAHVNRAPEFVAMENQSVQEDQMLTFVVEANDADFEDQGQLTFNAPNLPEGAGFDPATRTFAWTPTYEQSGEYTLVFEVTDPVGLTDQQTVTVIVNHVNREPSLEPIDPQTIAENQNLTLQLAGSDLDREDQEHLIYEIINLPEGARIDPASGIFTWTPSFDQAGQYELTGQVNDPGELLAAQKFSITVNNVNRPPQFEPIAAQTVNENERLAFGITALDPDAEDAGKLTFTASNLPQGASLDQTTGEFTWTPDYTQSGEYTVNFQVVDTFGESDVIEISITVNHVNRPPILSALSTQNSQEDREVKFVLPPARDEDEEDSGHLTYKVEGLPEGAAFNSDTREISWRPSFDQAGEYLLTYSASDGNAVSTKEFQLIVENVNRPPEIQSPGNQSVKEGNELKFKITVADPDREDQNNLKVEAINLPSGARFNASANEFIWTPDSTQQGNYSVDFIVSDSGGLSDRVTISVEVEDVPLTPATPQ